MDRIWIATFGGVDNVLGLGEGDMLPSVQEGVDGPRSRPDHGQRRSKDRQRYGNSCSRGRRESDPGFDASHENSCDGGPQAGNQQAGRQRSNALLDGGSAYRRRCQALEVAVKHSPADEHSLNQKPSTRPAIRERGK